MMTPMWLLFAAILGAIQAKFPQPEELKQYGTNQWLMVLSYLDIKTIPDNAFEHFPNLTVRITKNSLRFISGERYTNNTISLNMTSL